MDTFLDEVGDIAEEVSAEQRKVGREIRSLKQARERGLSWAEVIDQSGGVFDPLDRLRDDARKLATAAVRLAQGVADGLRSEGHSYRAIAARLGVTHQRISAMLGRRAGSGDRRL